MSGFGVLAGLLAITSTAYACTFYIGKMTVTKTTTPVPGSGSSVTSYGCSKASAGAAGQLAEQHVVSDGPNGIILNRKAPPPVRPLGDADFTITLDSTGPTPPPGLFCHGTTPLGDATPPYDQTLPTDQITPIGTYGVCIASVGYTAFSDFSGVPPFIGPGCQNSVMLDGKAGNTGTLGSTYATSIAVTGSGPTTSGTYTVPSALAGNVAPMQGVIQVLDPSTKWANQVPVFII